MRTKILLRSISCRTGGNCFGNADWNRLCACQTRPTTCHRAVGNTERFRANGTEVNESGRDSPAPNYVFPIRPSTRKASPTQKKLCPSSAALGQRVSSPLRTQRRGVARQVTLRCPGVVNTLPAGELPPLPVLPALFLGPWLETGQKEHAMNRPLTLSTHLSHLSKSMTHHALFPEFETR